MSSSSPSSGEDVAGRLSDLWVSGEDEAWRLWGEGGMERSLSLSTSTLKSRIQQEYRRPKMHATTSD